MTYAVSVTFEETGKTREVTRWCRICGVTEDSYRRGWVEIVVSPKGCAHFGVDYGMTKCGKDATRDGWWWPL